MNIKSGDLFEWGPAEARLGILLIIRVSGEDVTYMSFSHSTMHVISLKEVHRLLRDDGFTWAGMPWWQHVC